MKSDTLFLNISSDNVIISDWEVEDFLHRNDVEKILWPKLVQLIPKWNYENVLVLNWPWGFTNLRVWTLCLNILNTLYENQLNFFDISKIDLYKKLYDKWFLPKNWVIYIWQKRNIWLRDFEKNEKIWQYSFNELNEIATDPIFFDEVYDDNYYPDWVKNDSKIKIYFDWDNLNIDYFNKIIKSPLRELNLISIKSVSPNYMIDPSITL